MYISKLNFIFAAIAFNLCFSTQHSNAAATVSRNDNQLNPPLLRRFDDAGLKTKGKGPPLPKGAEPSADCQKCQSSLSFAGEEAKKYAVGNNM